MESKNQRPDYVGTDVSVVDSVMQLIGNVLSRDIVHAVVVHYNGDLNQSVDTIMSMYDGAAPPNIQTNTFPTPGNQTIPPTPINNVGTIISQHTTQNLDAPSTVELYKSTGAIPKQPTKPKETNDATCNIWTLQTQQIVDYHHQGSRTLILMRGLHISGKTYLATQLLKTMCPNADCKTHILSTDDFFQGKYRHDRSKLSEAHIWNQNRARQAMHQGLSPIFIDNTNVEIHEMEPYVKDGLNNGYIIEVLEPNTPWTKKTNQFVQQKNLSDYQHVITGIYVIRSCGLSYSAEKKPPVRRNIPPILATSHLEQPISTADQASVLIPHSSTNSTIQDNPLINSKTSRQQYQRTSTVSDQSDQASTFQGEFDENSFATSTSSKDKEQSSNRNTTMTPDDIKKITFIELRNKLKEFENFKQDWDSNNSESENSEASTRNQVQEKSLLVTPLHQRGLIDTNHHLPSSLHDNDWSKNSMRMGICDDYHFKVSSNIKAETATHSTSIEFSDTDMNNKNLKILIGTPKDINYYYMGLNSENIPKKTTLDKSTMTNDHNHISVEIASDSDSSLSMEFDSQESSDDCERTVNFNLGTAFVSELDQMFGRSDMIYPDNIITKINMPISLLNEINALWIESLMDQLEQHSRPTEIMLRQDEEFARQLALKEEQLAQAGLDPTVPDLKEVMDMELALSIYKDEITAEWRNNEPNDLAARTARDRLYNLFPDVLPETLSEVLMAHDSHFETTVEILLSSTSNAQILEEENGVAKFIAKKELERQKKILEEQKKAISEVAWPILPKEEKVNMSTFQDYRAKASQHLAKRNMYYQKAQEFFKRNMMDIASYYSDVAVMHKNKFEQANSLAAASLMQIHADKTDDNATIDLHYLHVPEAKVSLDLFIDTHIQKLRDSQVTGGPKYHTLFFITGRGKHSPGRPRIKPAVKHRLRERGISFAERNPGLLTSNICAEDKLTHQLR